MGISTSFSHGQPEVRSAGVVSEKGRKWLIFRRYLVVFGAGSGRVADFRGRPIPSLERPFLGERPADQTSGQPWAIREIDILQKALASRETRSVLGLLRGTFGHAARSCDSCSMASRSAQLRRPGQGARNGRPAACGRQRAVSSRRSAVGGQQ